MDYFLFKFSGVQFHYTMSQLFINGYNLTNARYAEFGGLYKNGEARYPMAGRSFIIGAEYTF